MRERDRGAAVLKAMIVMLILTCAMITLYGVLAGDPPRPGRACLANVKQLGTAIAMYLADNDGRYPIRDGWMDSLGLYTRSEAIYHCPAVSKTHPEYYGYAFNSWAAPRRETGVKDPANVPLIYDSINFARNASDPFASFPRYTEPEEKSRRTVFFVDGHARFEGSGFKGWKP